MVESAPRSFNTQGEIACQFTARAHTAAAEDAAALFQDEIFMRCIHIKGFPVRLQRPVGHVLVRKRHFAVHSRRR